MLIISAFCWKCSQQNVLITKMLLRLRVSAHAYALVRTYQSFHVWVGDHILYDSGLRATLAFSSTVWGEKENHFSDTSAILAEKINIR